MGNLGQRGKTNLNLLSAAVQSVFGAVGLGAVLYGIGFVAVRAHYASLGVSPGTLDAQEVADEGGRFLYHLLFLPSSAYSHVSWIHAVSFFAVPVVLSLVRTRVSTHVRAVRERLATHKLGALGTAVVSLALVISAILVETVWSALQIQDLLYTNTPSAQHYSSEGARTSLYVQVLWREIVVVLISVSLWRCIWRRVDVIARALILAQTLLVAGAVAAWPMVYGALITTDVRPSISSPTVPESGERLLLRKDESGYYIWNKSKRRVEVWNSETPITLGRKAHLLE